MRWLAREAGVLDEFDGGRLPTIGCEVGNWLTDRMQPGRNAAIKILDDLLLL